MSSDMCGNLRQQITHHMPFMQLQHDVFLSDLV
jgi:hypothetical protein